MPKPICPVCGKPAGSWNGVPASDSTIVHGNNCYDEYEARLARMPSKAPDTTSTSQPVTQSISTSEYGTAVFIGQFIAVIGWLQIIIGLIVLVIIGAEGTLTTPAVIAILIIALGGLITVAAGQLTRAMADTADNTREILMLLKR